MSVQKTVSIIALATLLGANVASAQVVAVCPAPDFYYENGVCTPYYPYPGHGQVINGQSVTQAPAPGTNTAQTGTVLGASTNVANLPAGAVNMTGSNAVILGSTATGWNPSVIAVREGSTVTFTNNGTSSFTVQSAGANGFPGFTSGLIPAGGTYVRVFDIPGTYTIQSMSNGQVVGTGTIVVLPAGSVSTVVTNGVGINTVNPAASGTGSVLGASTNQSNLPTGVNANGSLDTSAATTFNAINAGQTVAQVGIWNDRFDPHNVIIRQGGTVTWTNRGSMNHTIVADNGSFGSGSLAVGGTYSHIFNVPGAYLYYDTAAGGPHGTGMFGVIVVLAPGQTYNGGSVLNGTVGSNNGNGSVLGASTSNPNVPNTGTGGDASTNAFILAVAGLALLGGAYALRKKLALA